MISGHQEFFFLAIWWAGYFFPFFSHKLSITFVLHAIFFFRQALARNFISKSPPPSRVKWSAPKVITLQVLQKLVAFCLDLGQNLNQNSVLITELEKK